MARSRNCRSWKYSTSDWWITCDDSMSFPIQCQMTCRKNMESLWVLDVLLRPKASKARFFQPWQPRWVRLGAWHLAGACGCRAGGRPGPRCHCCWSSRPHWSAPWKQDISSRSWDRWMFEADKRGSTRWKTRFWELKIRHFTMITICDEWTWRDYSIHETQLDSCPTGIRWNWILKGFDRKGNPHPTSEVCILGKRFCHCPESRQALR